MKNFKYFFKYFLISILIILTSCDIIEAPYENTDEIIETPTENLRRAILIEFTGIKCTNCPQVSAEAHKIIDKYPGKVIGFNIHASELARPSNPNEPNFRTAEGNDIYALTNRPSLPAGLISKYLQPDAVSNSPLDWESRIIDIINEEAKLEIKIEKSTNINFELEFFEQLTSEYRIASYIIENNIIGYQLDLDGVIPDYKHEYVLRTALLGNIGTDVNLNEIIDNKLNVQANLPTLNSNWNEDNLYIICFVYDVNSGDVLQVNQLKYSE